MLGALSRPALEFTADLPASHPKLDALLAFWYAQRNDDALPQRSQFRARNLLPWLPHITMIDAIGEPPRFRVRLMGMACVRLTGADYTGRWVDECVAPEDRERTLRPYHESVATGQPARSNAVYLKDFGRVIVNRLYLPLADEKGEPTSILAALYDTDQPGTFDPLPSTAIRLK